MGTKAAAELAKDIRRRYGWSQKELADRVHILLPPHFIEKWNFAHNQSAMRPEERFHCFQDMRMQQFF